MLELINRGLGDFWVQAEHVQGFHYCQIAFCLSRLCLNLFLLRLWQICLCSGVLRKKICRKKEEAYAHPAKLPPKQLMRPGEILGLINSSAFQKVNVVLKTPPNWLRVSSVSISPENGRLRQKMPGVMTILSVTWNLYQSSETQFPS